jgi:cytochrome c553
MRACLKNHFSVFPDADSLKAGHPTGLFKHALGKYCSSNKLVAFSFADRILVMPLFLVCVFGCFVWNAAAGPLVWDSPDQTNRVNESDVSAHFTFKVRNTSTNEVIIDDVKPSCGCTVANLPCRPWRLAPKESSQFEVLVDLRDKFGTLVKQIAILSATAPTNLMTTVIMPERRNGLTFAEQTRIWGQQLAATDHQAVFKRDCVSCHLVPTFGKSGQALYQAACGICHEAEHRATMVPDLHALKTEIDTNYWRTWVTYGKAGTLMPGFAATEGGPLSDAQINSLVTYLVTAFPRPLKSAGTGPDDSND